MKLIIAGSRHIEVGICQLHDLIEEYCLPVTEVVCGLAKGPDLIGKLWAEDNKIPVKEFPANWELHGKRAGILRNIEMGNYSQELLAIWDGKSPGTKHMINVMRDLNKPYIIHIFQNDPF